MFSKCFKGYFVGILCCLVSAVGDILLVYCVCLVSAVGESLLVYFVCLVSDIG